jgi:hypothetical protein
MGKAPLANHLVCAQVLADPRDQVIIHFWRGSALGAHCV